MIGYLSRSGSDSGIYTFQLDDATGRATLGPRVAALDPAGFLAVAPDGRTLYATTTDPLTEASARLRRGRLHAFRIEPRTLALSPLGSQPTHGSSACHVGVHPSGRCVVVANFRQYGANGAPGEESQGSVAAFAVNPDGSVGEAADVREHEGRSSHPTRQSNSHPHAACPHPAGRFVLVPDLGTDRIVVYAFDPARARFTPAATPCIAVPPLTGPRHLAFHPTRDFVYVINEIGNTMTFLLFDRQSGALSSRQTLSTLPADWQGGGDCADVQVHPSGRYVYGSNRGHNSIVVYAVDEATGRLTWRDCVTAPLCKPVDFILDATGRWLLAPGRDALNVFAIDAATGGLRPLAPDPAFAPCGAVCAYPAPGAPRQSPR